MTQRTWFTASGTTGRVRHVHIEFYLRDELVELRVIVGDGAGDQLDRLQIQVIDGSSNESFGLNARKLPIIVGVPILSFTVGRLADLIAKRVKITAAIGEDSFVTDAGFARDGT